METIKLIDKIVKEIPCPDTESFRHGLSIYVKPGEHLIDCSLRDDMHKPSVGWLKQRQEDWLSLEWAVDSVLEVIGEQFDPLHRKAAVAPNLAEMAELISPKDSLLLIPSTRSSLILHPSSLSSSSSDLSTSDAYICPCRSRRGLKCGRKRTTLILPLSDLLLFPASHFNQYLQDRSFEDFTSPIFCDFISYLQTARELVQKRLANAPAPLGNSIDAELCGLGAGKSLGFQSMLLDSALSYKGILYLTRERERRLNKLQQRKSRSVSREQCKRGLSSSSTSPPLFNVAPRYVLSGCKNAVDTKSSSHSLSCDLLDLDRVDKAGPHSSPSQEPKSLSSQHSPPTLGTKRKSPALEPLASPPSKKPLLSNATTIQRDNEPLVSPIAVPSTTPSTTTSSSHGTFVNPHPTSVPAQAILDPKDLHRILLTASPTKVRATLPLGFHAVPTQPIFSASSTLFSSPPVYPFFPQQPSDALRQATPDSLLKSTQGPSPLSSMYLSNLVPSYPPPWFMGNFMPSPFFMPPHHQGIPPMAPPFPLPPHLTSRP